MTSRAWLAMAFVMLVVAAPAGAMADTARLSDMADDLQRLQVQVAHGDRAAYAAQLKLLKKIGAAIEAAKPETWKDEREADSLVIYILSGGSLAEVASLVKDGFMVETARSLTRGAIAYVTSHETDALAFLAGADLSALDPRLAGQVAFARSVLETRRDPRAAVALLDWARLLAPGGLVEEAALRREIRLLAEARDARRAAMLTRQYSTRFAASLYAADFFRGLAKMVGRLGLADDPADFRLLSNAVAALPSDGRRDFLLTLAETAVVYARFTAASAAASEALQISRPDSANEARARLYLDAGRILSGGYDAAITDLRGLAGSRFDRSDAGLLASVRSVAAQLRVAPAAGAVEAQGGAPTEAAKKGDEGPAATIERAQHALERTSLFVAATEGSPR
jgi:chemotaxis protein MotC